MNPSFDPGKSKFRAAFPLVPGFRSPVTAFDKHFRVTGGTLSNEPEVINLSEITGSRQRTPGLRSKIPSNGQLDVELNLEAHLWALAQAQERWSVSSPAAGVEVLRMAPSEANAGPSRFDVEMDLDQNRIQVFSSGQVSSLQLSLGPRGVKTAAINTIFEYADYWADGIVTADPTPNTSAPIVRGIITRDQWNAASGEELFIEAVDVGGLPGEIQVLAKIGSAAFGAIPTILRVGTNSAGKPYWTELIDSTTGGRLGDGRIIEIALLDATGFEVADGYQYDRHRGQWVQAIPQVLPLNEIYAGIILDTEVIRLNSFEVTLTPPVDAVWNIGGQWPDDVRNRGEREVSVTLGREQMDNDLRDRLESGEPFAVRVDAKTGHDFVPGHEHELSAIFPHVIGQGRTTGLGNKNAFDESIAGVAYPDETNAQGFVDDMTMLVKSTISDPTA